MCIELHCVIPMIECVRRCKLLLIKQTTALSYHMVLFSCNVLVFYVSESIHILRMSTYVDLEIFNLSGNQIIEQLKQNLARPPWQHPTWWSFQACTFSINCGFRLNDKSQYYINIYWLEELAFKSIFWPSKYVYKTDLTQCIFFLKLSSLIFLNNITTIAWQIIVPFTAAVRNQLNILNKYALHFHFSKCHSLSKSFAMNVTFYVYYYMGVTFTFIHSQFYRTWDQSLFTVNNTNQNIAWFDIQIHIIFHVCTNTSLFKPFFTSLRVWNCVGY